MDDLPEALRDLAPVTHDMQHTFKAEILFEAADRIEALEAEKAALRRALFKIAEGMEPPVLDTAQDRCVHMRSMDQECVFCTRALARAALARQTEGKG